MIKEEIVTIDIKMSDGKVLRCNGYEKSLEEAIETIKGKLDELRFDRTVAGRLRTALMELWNQEVTADFFARELVRRGWTDEPLVPTKPRSKPEPEPIALSTQDEDAIRALMWSAKELLDTRDGSISRSRRVVLAEAIETMTRVVGP